RHRSTASSGGGRPGVGSVEREPVEQGAARLEDARRATRRFSFVPLVRPDARRAAVPKQAGI
ncbi:unnamed protein product, partial [Closterium sp. NIES-53]